MMKNEESVEEADRLFHHIIANSTRNSAVMLSVENLWTLRKSSPKVIADYASVCSKDNPQTLAEHTAIYNALKSGDSAEVRAAMHKLFYRLISTLFDSVEAKALEEVRRKNSEKCGLYSIPTTAS